MTSIGHEKESKIFVFRIHKKTRCTRIDSRWDIGRSCFLETKRSGMEDAITNLKENGVRLLHKWCNDSRKLSPFSQVPVPWLVESWRSCKERNHTLQCGYLDHRALIPNHSFCQSAQCLRRSFKMERRVRSEAKENSVNRQMLKSVNSQEVKSLVCVIQGRKQPPGTDCKNIFRPLNHYPELSNSQGFANLHHFGTG